MRRMMLAAAALAACTVPAMAVQFDVLDPGYTQEIYAGPGIGAAIAWTSSGHMLTRLGSTITEYNGVANTTYKGTSTIHGVIGAYNIPNLDPGGTGITTGLDGYIYALSTSGLQRVDPTNFAAPAVTLVTSFSGPGYGITTMPDGRIAYADGVGGASKVFMYDPASNTNALIYSTASQPGGGYLIDGIVSSPTGNIALTGQDNKTINIISSTGTLINSWTTTHFPDGLAFAENPTMATLYSNNNDGTISRYDLGPGFTGTPTTTDIALQTLPSGKAYGDLASVGPDCAFYVSQFENGGYHGSTPGTGTHWDDGTTSAESSIIRIGSGVGPDGNIVCDFYSPLMPADHAPEPNTLALLGVGLAAMARCRRPSK